MAHRLVAARSGSISGRPVPSAMASRRRTASLAFWLPMSEPMLWRVVGSSGGSARSRNSWGRSRAKLT